MDTKDYVLGAFSKNDLDLIRQNFSTINKIIESFNYKDINLLMNKYN